MVSGSGMAAVVMEVKLQRAIQASRLSQGRVIAKGVVVGTLVGPELAPLVQQLVAPLVLQLVAPLVATAVTAAVAPLVQQHVGCASEKVSMIKRRISLRRATKPGA